MSVLDAKHLASHVARQARLTNGQAEDAINAIGTVIIKQLQNGHAVALDGFGLFEVAEREDGVRALRVRQAKRVRETLNED